jgi:hypothetical protein
VQAGLNANIIAKKVNSKASSFLLQGLLFDSAGNRMTPSHSRKKGVRYRYYISQAILQSRKSQAGQIFRVPAPDIEAVVERFLLNRYPDQQGDLRSLAVSRIARITIQADSISMELTSEACSEQADGPIQTVSLPWSKKPFQVAKGIQSSVPAYAPETDSRARRTILLAITKARRWVDELKEGRGLADLAAQEGCTARHVRAMMPLAFVSPYLVRAILNGTMLAEATVTDLVQNFPLLWSEQERRFALR